MANASTHLQDFEFDYDGRKHEVGLVYVAIEPDGGTEEEKIRETHEVPFSICESYLPTDER